jgi:diguanylate cyclase (GGDEF)-like protein
MSETLVGLHLDRARPPGGMTSEADAFRRMLGEAFGTLADVLAAADAGTRAEVMSIVDGCRAEIAKGTAADIVEPLAQTCFEATRGIAAHSRNRTAEQRAQIAAVVTMVQETVAAMAGDEANLDETLIDSANRFERLAGVNDLRLIQAQLISEVTTLKRVTIERRAAWEQTFQDFGTRLSTLETQLDRTRREAALDPLTNIGNRRTYERTCREWLEPNRPGFVMAMLDMDDFKAINDRCGHAVGDKVLVAVADTLARSLRTGDLVARLGGDEFGLLMAGLTLRQAEGRLAAVGRTVQEVCRPIAQNAAVTSITIGVAECSAGDTFESLQERADAALYEAKKSGKGRVASKASPLIRDLLKRGEARIRQ